MSDNIDYAELDRAVSEAIQQKKSTPAKTAGKQIAKPTIAPKPATKPRGQYIDFIRTQPLPAPRASSIHVIQPSARVVTAAKPVAKPVAKPTVKPVAKPVRTTAHQDIARPVAKPAARPSVAAQIQKKQQNAAARPVAKPVARPEVKPAAKPVATSTAPAKKAATTPNANNYSLGVRSPFMTNTKVEKRPLGTDFPDSSTAALRSTRNVYSSKSPSKSTPAAAKKHIVTEAPKKQSGWIRVLIVLLVLAAGAGLGYLAFKLVFAN